MPIVEKLQGTADVVDALFWVVRVDDFKDDIVTGFKLADDGIELLLVRGWLAIDAGYDKARLETLQVCEGAGAHRANYHAGGVNLACHGGGHVVHHNAELGFACAAGGSWSS